LSLITLHSRAPRRALHTRPLVRVFHLIRKPTQMDYAQTNLGHRKLTNGSKHAPMAPRTHLEYRGTSLIRKRPPPYDHHRAPGMVLLQGPRRRRFLMSEAPLYPHEGPCVVRLLRGGRCGYGPWTGPLISLDVFFTRRSAERHLPRRARPGTVPIERCGYLGSEGS